MRVGRTLVVFLAALLLAKYSVAQTRRGGNPQAAGVYQSQINPNWFHNSTRFWYRNDLRGTRKEFILVDAATGTRSPAFDHQQLATALSKAGGIDVQPDRLPLNS